MVSLEMGLQDYQHVKPFKAIKGNYQVSRNNINYKNLI